MGIFKTRKAKQPQVDFDKENMQPVIRCSICTGEQVAGFKDKRTGKFSEVMLIRNTGDLDTFKEMYQLDVVLKEY